MVAGPVGSQRQPLRLVHAPGSVDRGTGGGLTLVSQASLEALASAAGVESVDARRFRMLVEIDGVGAHEEDEWVGRMVRLGIRSPCAFAATWDAA